MAELFSVRGNVTGTGILTLDSSLLYSTVDHIRIPKGLKLKAWCKRISGEAADVDLEFTTDVTAETPTWKKIDSQKLASPGELTLEKRKPLIAQGFRGTEAIQVNRVAGTGDSFIDLELEVE